MNELLQLLEQETGSVLGSALKGKGYKSWVLNKQALTHNCFAVSALWPVKGVTLGSCACCAQKPLEGPLILPVLPVSLVMWHQ